MKPMPVANARKTPAGGSLFPNLLMLIVGTLYLVAVLSVDSQGLFTALLVGGLLVVAAAIRFDLISSLRAGYRENERVLDALSIAAVAAIAVYFHNSPFVLFLLSTVFIYIIACLGLNLQFGYAGMLNFAGAAMLGVGGYTAAVVGAHDAVPKLLLLPLGGIAAVVVGSILLPPMLRTQGHYSAVITIAFNLLFMTFLEVNGLFGGTQGLPVHGLNLFGFSFNENWKVAGISVAFYFNYFVVAFVLTILAVVAVRRLERSWIGLSLDSIRLDETSSKCFGIDIRWWKSVAFTAGNFIMGVAGTLYALMLGYIAPSNFTFGDSLILVTIIILGGLGSTWGTILAAAIVIILPEKLQTIQEYRFLIFAILVVLVLRFRPNGLLPRAARVYFAGWRL